MPRVPRRYPWASQACFHLIDRGHHRERTFADDEDRDAFVGLLQRYHQRLGLRLYHGYLMDNHFHVLLQRFPG